MICTKDHDCEVPNCLGPHAVSDPDEKLDHLVQQASIPTLADLYKRARAKGLTRPQSAYQ